MKTRIISSSPILGIDIAKAKFDACLQLANGPSRLRTFTNNEEGFAALLEWLRAQDLQHVAVAMEATGPYWVALACYLHAHTLSVYVLNPAYVKAHAQSRGFRTKTDRVDARLIADYLATHECEAWEPLPAELEQLRELMRLYADVTALAVSAGRPCARPRPSSCRPNWPKTWRRLPSTCWRPRANTRASIPLWSAPWSNWTVFRASVKSPR